MELTHLVTFLNEFLDAPTFKDYAPNGLQVQGRSQVKRIVTGTTACLALIEEAIGLNADAILVHHGWFWKGERPEITGVKYARLKALMEHDISLIAYHLPLDAHESVGNNSLLAKRLNFVTDERVGEMGLLHIGHPQSGCYSAQSLNEWVSEQMGRDAQVVGHYEGNIDKIAWCSGAAQDEIELAASVGAQAFISGEISERTTHLARELNLVYIAAGHHATERDGIKALGQVIEKTFEDVEVIHVDVDNPV